MTTLDTLTKPLNKRTLGEWRGFLGLTKQEVAQAVGVHPTTWTNWEQNPERVRMFEAAKIAEVFNCTTNEINFFEGIPKYNLGFVDGKMDKPEAIPCDKGRG